MDVSASTKARLPSRQVTEGPGQARRHSYFYAMDIAAEWLNQRAACGPSRGTGLTPSDAAEVFKKTPCIADLKPRGRDVAKDIFEFACIPILMKTPPDHGFLHGECKTVAGRVIAENRKSVKCHPDQAEKQRYADA